MLPTFTAEKTYYKDSLGFKERLQIKAFKNNDAMYAFLCSSENDNNKWKESTRGLKAGIYAYAGGKWHNTKTLDSSILAYI